MKLLRRATPPPQPAPPVLDSKGAEALTRRRVEVIVEREWARESVPAPPTPIASFEAFCMACGCRVPMLTPAAGALIAHVTIRTIYRWVDEKRLHFLESTAGDLYLCANSIAAAHQTQQLPPELPSGDPR